MSYPSLPFSEFSLELLEKMEHMTEPTQIVSALESPLQLPAGLSAAEHDIITSIFMYLYAFCKEHNFSFAEMSTLLSIMNSTIRTDMERRRTIAESFNEFKTLVLRHSVQRPPVSIKVFERENVSKLMDYTLKSYFKQFRLYQLIFARHQASASATAEANDPQGPQAVCAPETSPDDNGEDKLPTDEASCEQPEFPTIADPRQEDPEAGPAAIAAPTMEEHGSPSD